MNKNARIFIKELIKDEKQTLNIAIFILSSVSRPNRSLAKFELGQAFLFENNSSRFWEPQLIKLTWDYVSVSIKCKIYYMINWKWIILKVIQFGKKKKHIFLVSGFENLESIPNGFFDFQFSNQKLKHLFKYIR